MKKATIFIVGALVLVLSLSLMMAVPVTAQDTFNVIPFTLDTATGTAEWSTSANRTGSWGVNIGTDTNGSVGRVIFDWNQNLSTITDMGYAYRMEAGHGGAGWDATPYIVFELDTTADTFADTWVVHHMFTDAVDKNVWTDWELADDASIPAEYWVTGSTTNHWHSAGATTAEYADWAAIVTAFGNDMVLKIKVAVGDWASSIETRYYVDDIEINGVTYYGKIQDAIDAADTSDIIAVAAGTYTEDITIEQSLTLQSTSGALVTKLTGTGGTDPVVGIGDYNVTLKGFEIDTGQEGVYIATIDAGNVVTIENSVIHGNTEEGIDVGTVYGTLNILNNIIADHAASWEEAIYISTVDDGGIVVIQGNKLGAWEDADWNFGGNEVGIGISIVSNGGTVTIGGATKAKANIISGNVKMGIVVNDIATGSTLTIEGNTIGAYAYDGYSFAGNGMGGIRFNNVDYGSTVTIRDSVIHGNTEQGIEVQFTVYGTLNILNNIIADNTYEGIYINKVDGGGIVVIQGNKAGAWEDAGYNLVGNGYQGIYIKYVFNGSTVTIGGDTEAEANLIAENTLGGIYIFWVYNDGSVSITGNDILDNTTYGIYILDVKDVVTAGSVDVHYNNIAGNTTYGVEYRYLSSDEYVDAENNWWGDISGPSGEGTGSGDAVSTDVDYIPWLDAAGGSSLYPAYNSTTSRGYDTIQEAVAAALTNAVITIAPGTYTGDLTINQNLTLVSSGGALVTKLDGTGGGPVITVGDFDVTIDGFDIDPGVDGVNIPTISIGNVVTIEDSVIYGNTEQGIDVGTVYGELYILNNIIAQNAEEGIYIDEVNAGIVFIQGNKIGAWEDADHASPNDFAGNVNEGIFLDDVLNGSTVTIGGDEAAEANIISGNTSYGIYVYELYYGSTLTIEGNTSGAYAYDGYTFAGNSYGVYVEYVDYGSTLTIKNNIISENTWDGLFIYYLGYHTHETEAEYYALFQDPSYGANTVTIEGNTASGNGDFGIYISYANFASNITIEDNITSANDYGIALEFFGQYGAGFYLDYDSSDVHVDPDYDLYFGPVVLVKGNTTTDNTNYGILQYDNWEYGTSVTIEDNVISGNKDAGIGHEFDLMNDAHVVIRGNTITSNGITNAKGGIYWGDEDYIEYASSYTVEDNLIAGNWGNGMNITEVRYSSDLIISGNTIGAGTDAQGSQYPGNDNRGIIIDKVYDYSTAEISGNTISGNTTDGIAIDYVYLYSSADITGNIITGNLYDGIYITYVEDDGSVSITYNDILDNAGYGIYIHDVKSTAGSLDAHYNNIAGNGTTGVTNAYTSSGEYVDASNNWWGDISGPGTVGPGSGDDVSTYVTFSPWLPMPSVWGVRVELTEDWNTLSTPIALDSASDELAELSLDIEIAYGFNGVDWVLITTANDTLEPCAAYYVKMNSSDTVDLVPSELYTDLPSRTLNAGWNLVSLANIGDMAAEDALASVYLAISGDLSGYAQVVSPSVNGATWSAVRRPTIDEDLGYDMLPGKGYWVFMTNAGTIVGFTATP